MDLVFVCEGHFIKDATGRYYCVNTGFTNQLWKRYLAVFNCIRVLARVKIDLNYQGEEALRADNPCVTFADLPDYVGPLQYVKVRGKIKKIFQKEIVIGKAYLCRLPGEMGGMAISVLKQRNIPYACEVVGDPWDVFAPGGVQHPLRPFFRYKGRYSLKKQVASASNVLYVTKKSLQKRYPCSKDVFCTNASNVLLFPEKIVKNAKFLEAKNKYQLISVGSLEQMYKSPDVVIKALSQLKSQGINCYLSWLGDGKYKKEMMDLAESLNVADRVCFYGNVSAEEVVTRLNGADIFLLVSKTEGLPRAMIEAMAQGLPCIGSDAGGISELLDASVIVPKGDAEALAGKIAYMITHLSFTNQQAERNLREAANYENGLLDLKRNRFYKEIVQQVNK